MLEGPGSGLTYDSSSPPFIGCVRRRCASHAAISLVRIAEPRSSTCPSLILLLVLCFFVFKDSQMMTRVYGGWALVLVCVVACGDDDGSRGADVPVADAAVESDVVATDAGAEESELATDEEDEQTDTEEVPSLAPNHPPEGEDIAVLIEEDTPADILLPGMDEDGDLLEFIITTLPRNGELQQSGDSVTYTPHVDYHGRDSFEYAVGDGMDTSDTYSVRVDVSPVNDTPVAVDDRYSIERGGMLSGANLLENDFDVDGDDLAVSVVQDAALGTLNVDVTGVFSYEHGGGAQQTDTFSYEVCDPSGACDLATVVLDVERTNQAPSVEPDIFDVEMGGVTRIEAPGVLANDADPEGSVLESSVVEGPISGTLALAGDGSFSYTHDGSASGRDAFRYQACDEGGACAATDVVLNVVDRSRLPSLAADEFSVAEGGTLTSAPRSLLDNDTDPTGSVLNVTIAPSSAPSRGTLALNADGTFTYQHDGSETRTDSFSYEACNSLDDCANGFVTIMVSPVNDPPAAADDTYTLVEGEVLQAQTSVLDNDLDAESDPLSARLVAEPSSGTLAFSEDGLFEYQHDGGVAQQDEFTYEVCDASGACDVATVTLNIDPRNNPPVAAGDVYRVLAEVEFRNVVSVLNNDVDPDGDQLSVADVLVAEPNYGTVSMDAMGYFSYLRTAPGTISDSFTYEACDPYGLCAEAIVRMVVDSPNTAPNAPNAVADSYVLDEGALFSSGVASLLDNDTDPDAGEVLVVKVTPVSGPAHGTLILAGDGTFSYQHDGSETASDSFTYEVCDPANACDTAVVSLTITPQNDPPTAVDDMLTVDEGASGSVNLLSNDIDVDMGDSLSGVTVMTPPSHGTVTALNATTGLLTYQHDGTETTEDSLTYRVQDSSGATATATLTISVTPVDDPASAVNDSYSNVTGNTALTVGAPGVLANDSDPDGPSLAACPQTNGTTAEGGLITLNASGSFSYLPPVGLRSTTDTFTYRVASPNCTSGPTATVSLTVGAAAAWYVDPNSTQTGDGRGDFGGASYGYQTLAGLSSATLQSGDVVVVYRNNDDPTPAGSALDAEVNLPDGVALVGDGVALPNPTRFPPADYPNLNLPHVSVLANLDGPPRITNSTGVAVSLAGNNAVVGLDIASPAGSGIADSDDAFDDVLIDTVTVSAAGISGPGDALDLSNGAMGGSVIVRNAFFTSADGAAFSVVNASSVSVDDDEASPANRDMTLDAIGGPAFSVIGAGTSLNVVLSELNSTGSSGSGVVISGASGTFTVSGTTTVTSSASAGLLVQDASATATSASLAFNGLVTVNNTATSAGGLSLSGYSGALAFASADIDTSAGVGLAQSGTSSGTVSFSGAVDINATTGHGLSLSGSSTSITFDANLTSVTTSGTALQTTMGGTVATNGALVLNSSSGTALSVSGTHLVMDLTETNSLTASGGVGINVSSCSGCQVDFDTVTVTNPGGVGVSLTSSTGSSFSFSGLAISTNIGAGLFANGAGTVSVTGATNTVTTTGATGVELTNTTIGAPGVTLLSVSANGGAEGLHLESTGTTGAFQVTGIGTTAQSGGVIDTLTGNGVVLSSVQNVTLKNLQIGTPVAVTADKSTAVTVAGDGIDMSSATDVTLEGLDIGSTGTHGIDGTGVVNLTVRNTEITNSGDADGESGVSFEELGQNNLSGSVLFDTVTIAGSTDSNLAIENSSGTLNATFTGCVFRRTFDSGSLGFGQHGMLLRSQSTATMTVLVDDGTFLEHEADGLDAIAEDTSAMNLTLQNSYFEGILQSAAPTNYSDNAIVLRATDTATLRFTVDGNDIQDHPSTAIDVSSDLSSALNGTVSNNTVGTIGVSDSGSESGYGIDVFLDDNSTSALSISGNTLHGHEGYGIQVITQNLHAGNITLEDNTIGTPNNNGPPFSFSWEPMYLRTAGTSSACFDVNGNAAAVGATDFGITGASIYASANSASTFNLHQGGSASSVPVTVLADNNPASFSYDSSGPVTVVAAACTLPGATPTPP